MTVVFTIDDTSAILLAKEANNMLDRENNHSTFEAIYKRLEEVMLANSGENEFEEIFKLLVLKLWAEMGGIDKVVVPTIQDANILLSKIDKEWSGVLTETSFKISDEQFSVCISIVNSYYFTADGFEGIDGLFEFIVSKEKKGSKGQYFTPRHIVDFCVKVINPKLGETVLDPAAGSGAFLYHSYRNGLTNGEDLWGFDFDNTAVRVARLLLHVAGIEGFHVYKANSLIKQNAQRRLFCDAIGDISTSIEDILRIEKQKELFDIIITNPPFAGEIVEPDILESYEISYGKNRIERDVLFVERCIGLLKPGGRMAIVLPDNIFGGKDTESLRKLIYNRCRIVGVIGIPRNAFMPHTSVKTSILFLQKRVKERQFTENVFFGISEKPGKDGRGKTIYKTAQDHSWKNIDSDLDEICDGFKKFIRKEELGW